MKKDHPPTPQGPQSAGPGNAHGVQPPGRPDDSATEPIFPEPAPPAEDPDAMARRVLEQAKKQAKRDRR